MIRIISFLLTLSLWSCSNESEPKSIEEKISQTFESGHPKVISKYENNLEIHQKHFYRSGKIQMQGPVINGKRNGKWYSYYENNQLQSTGFYENGMRMGKVETFFENGQPRYIGEFSRNKKSGVWTFYDETGLVIKTEKF